MPTNSGFMIRRQKPRRGFTLVEVMFGLSACLAGLQLAGSTSIALAVVVVFFAAAMILMATILWGLSYLRAPDLTCNVTVLVIIGLVTLSFLPNRMLHIRETARRQTATDSLRQIGQVIHALHDTRTPGNMQDRYQEHQQTVAEESEAP